MNLDVVAYMAKDLQLAAKLRRVCRGLRSRLEHVWQIYLFSPITKVEILRTVIGKINNPITRQVVFTPKGRIVIRTDGTHLIIKKPVALQINAEAYLRRWIQKRDLYLYYQDVVRCLERRGLARGQVAELAFRDMVRLVESIVPIDMCLTYEYAAVRDFEIEPINIAKINRLIEARMLGICCYDLLPGEDWIENMRNRNYPVNYGYLTACYKVCQVYSQTGIVPRTVTILFEPERLSIVYQMIQMLGSNPTLDKILELIRGKFHVCSLDA